MSTIPDPTPRPLRFSREWGPLYHVLRAGHVVATLKRQDDGRWVANVGRERSEALLLHEAKRRVKAMLGGA